MPGASRLNCPAAAGVATCFAKVFDFAAVEVFPHIHAVLAWTADPTVSPRSKYFIAFLGYIFVDYFFLFFLGKFLCWSQWSRLGFSLIFLFSLFSQEFPCAAQRPLNSLWEPLAASFRAQRKKDESRSTCIPVSAVTSVSVAPIGALCKGCRGCVARRRQTLPAAVIQHCSIGL